MADTIMVTGAAGFIGSNFIRYWQESHPSDKIIAVDALTYAGNLRNLDGLDEIRFIECDIAKTSTIVEILQRYSVDIIVNFAAESHNSLAVRAPADFFSTNVMGTIGLLEAIRHVGVHRFHHVSSSEVYGEVEPDNGVPFSEDSPYHPSTAYSASKAAADHAIRAYCGMYSIPITIGVSVNNYGPFQFPEKIIPLFTTNALEGKPLPLYSSTLNRREYIHVTDHCAAIDAIVSRGVVGSTYNVGTGDELTIEEIADHILTALKLPASMKKIVPNRPMHSWRHALDSSKIRRELGWQPKVLFTVGLVKTVEWYRENFGWWTESITRRKVKETGW